MTETGGISEDQRALALMTAIGLEQLEEIVRSPSAAAYLRSDLLRIADGEPDPPQSGIRHLRVLPGGESS